MVQESRIDPERSWALEDRANANEDLRRYVAPVRRATLPAWTWSESLARKPDTKARVRASPDRYPGQRHLTCGLLVLLTIPCRTRPHIRAPPGCSNSAF